MTKPIHRLLVVWTLWVTLGVFLDNSHPVLAAPSTSSESGAAKQVEDLRDPEALAELVRATDFLTAQQSFRLHANIIYDVIQEDGRRLQFGKNGEIDLQRPDRLYAEVYLDDGRQRQFWYDGTTLSFAERPRNVHTQVKAPPTIDATLDMLERLLKDPMPLADLLYSDLAPLEQRAVEAEIVGNSMVNGRWCRHLTFRGETVDWQLWIEQGDQPFIRKLVISYRAEPGVPQYVAWIDTWDLPEVFSDERFRFVVPEGSEFIKVLMPGLAQSGGGGQP
jgi:hypothetical protein